jgi:hypothetical protein
MEMGVDPTVNGPVRARQTANDIPNNWLGTIAASAEADLQVLGDLGDSIASQWHCLGWLKELSWDEVKQLVGVQTVRPSGRYSGPFHTAYRKCVEMVRKL